MLSVLFVVLVASSAAFGVEVIADEANICDGLVNGFHARPSNCSEFLFCLNDVHFIGECGDGLVWHNARSRCEPVANVPAPCGTAQQPQPLSCTGREFDQKYRNPHNCSQYFSCSLDTLNRAAVTVEECDSGDAFEELSQSCRPATIVAGCQPTTADLLFPFCSRQSADGLFAVPNDCSMVTACVGGWAFTFQCPPERPQWSAIESNCVPSDGSCNELSSTTMAPASDEMKMQMQQLITNLTTDPLCEGRLDGLYPKEDDCSRFVFCLIGTATWLECEPGMVFSPEKRQCLPIGEVAAPCGTAVIRDSIPTCTGVAEGALLADANNCTQFYKCQRGIAARMECDEGMAFDSLSRECLPSAIVVGCAPPMANNLTDFCRVQPSNGLFVDPQSCHRAIICLGGNAFYHVCNWPGADYFHPQLLRCAAVPDDLELDEKTGCPVKIEERKPRQSDKNGQPEPILESDNEPQSAQISLNGQRRPGPILEDNRNRDQYDYFERYYGRRCRPESYKRHCNRYHRSGRFRPHWFHRGGRFHIHRCCDFHFIKGNN